MPVPVAPVLQTAGPLPLPAVIFAICPTQMGLLDVRVKRGAGNTSTEITDWVLHPSRSAVTVYCEVEFGVKATEEVEAPLLQLYVVLGLELACNVAVCPAQMLVLPLKTRLGGGLMTRLTVCTNTLVPVDAVKV